MALALLSSMVWDRFETCYAAPIKSAFHAKSATEVVVLSLTDVPASSAANIAPPADTDIQSDEPETCFVTAMAALSHFGVQTAAHDKTSAPVAPKSLPDVLNPMEGVFARTAQDKVDLVSFARRKMWPGTTDLYRSVLNQVAIMALPQIEEIAALTDGIYIGTASTYNPYRDGIDPDSGQTASGEPYDPSAWTAAIQIGLRERFGGVRYGKLYQPAFALIESGDKRVIVKINDVGPLKPGRVVDLNERSMRYFDPTLERGLVPDIRITALPGEGWTPGPVGGVELASLTSTPVPPCVTCVSKFAGDRDPGPAPMANRYRSNFLNTASN
jgi:rare lipoprotein A